MGVSGGAEMNPPHSESGSRIQNSWRNGYIIHFQFCLYRREGLGGGHQWREHEPMRVQRTISFTQLAFLMLFSHKTCLIL